MAVSETTNPHSRTWWGLALWVATAVMGWVSMHYPVYSERGLIVEYTPAEVRELIGDRSVKWCGDPREGHDVHYWETDSLMDPDTGFEFPVTVVCLGHNCERPDAHTTDRKAGK